MEKICSTITKVALLVLVVLSVDSFLILGTYNYVPDFLEWTMGALVLVSIIAIGVRALVKKFHK